MLLVLLVLLVLLEIPDFDFSVNAGGGEELAARGEAYAWDIMLMGIESVIEP